MSDYPFTFEHIGVDWMGAPAVKVLPCEFTIPETFVKGLGNLYNLEVREDDIWLMGLWKTGTTWASEAVWGVYHEADLTEAKSKYTLERWMMPEMNVAVEYTLLPFTEEGKNKAYKTSNHYFTGDIFKTLKEAKSPRFIRTYVPLPLLPPNLIDTCKVVYIARNIKDTWVSMFKMFEGGPCEASDITSLFKIFTENRGPYSPHCRHVIEAWKLRNHKNMFFVFYEEMRKDLSGVLRRLAKFLDKNLSEEQIKSLEDHLSMDSMRKNKYTNCEDFKQVGWLGDKHQFIRRGMVGEWKEYFTEELLEEYQTWWNTYAGDTDLTFPEN